MGIYITILIFLVVICLPMLFGLPFISGDERIYVKNDTIFIDGPYSISIPKTQIQVVKLDVKVPDIRVRTNGLSVGEINIGHFQTVEDVPVLLYLTSDHTPVTFIKTKSGDNIYLNFKDEQKYSNFVNSLQNENE